MTIIRRVMLVEDNEDHRLLIGAALTALKLEWESYASAEAALAAAPDKFDMVFADVRLAGISGIEFAARCRPLGVPVVMLSTSEDPEDIRASLNAGAVDYVTKATGMHQLQEKISTAIAGLISVQTR